METLETISKRHSVRQYTTQGVEEEKIGKIIEAAQAAPVGMGQYNTMHLTVVQSPEVLAALTEAGKEAFGGRNLIYGAPALVIVSTKPSEQVPGMEKLGAATIMENMILAATDMGLGSVFLLAICAALAQNSDIMKQLQIPDGFVPTAAMALGYAATEAKGAKHTIEVTRL